MVRPSTLFDLYIIRRIIELNMIKQGISFESIKTMSDTEVFEFVYLLDILNQQAAEAQK